MPASVLHITATNACEHLQMQFKTQYFPQKCSIRICVKQMKRDNTKSCLQEKRAMRDLSPLHPSP